MEKLARRRLVTDLLTAISGTALVLVGAVGDERTTVIVGAYGLLLGTSTAVVTFSLTRFTGINIGTGSTDEAAPDGGEESERSLLAEVWQIFTGKALENDADIEEDTGWLIGRLENVIVLTLVLAGEYTALSIVFAAKSWVRRDDTAGGNTTYYLAGTLANFTYSIVVGIGLGWVIDSF